MRHIISARGIEVDKAKIDLVRSLPSPTTMQEVSKETNEHDRSISAFLFWSCRFLSAIFQRFFKITRRLCRLL